MTFAFHSNFIISFDEAILFAFQDPAFLDSTRNKKIKISFLFFIFFEKKIKLTISSSIRHFITFCKICKKKNLLNSFFLFFFSFQKNVKYIFPLWSWRPNWRALHNKGWLLKKKQNKQKEKKNTSLALT